MTNAGPPQGVTAPTTDTVHSSYPLAFVLHGEEIAYHWVLFLMRFWRDGEQKNERDTLGKNYLWAKLMAQGG